jgi:excisionase family DNA binding protein
MRCRESIGDGLVPRTAFSVEEVAESTGLSRSTIYRQMDAGLLEYKKIGGRRIITVSQLERFLEAA